MGRANGSQHASSGSESFTAVFGQRRGDGNSARPAADPAPAAPMTKKERFGDILDLLGGAYNEIGQTPNSDMEWGITKQGLDLIEQAEKRLRDMRADDDANEAFILIRDFWVEYDEPDGYLSEQAQLLLERAIERLGG